MDTNILNLDFPATIETPRLTIRSPQPGDGPEFNAAVLESLDGMRKWLGAYNDGPPTLADSEAFVRKKFAEFQMRQYMLFICFLKGTSTMVVTSTLLPNWNVPAFEIGYWCRGPYQRQGFVTEAVRGVTEFAFDQLSAKRVFICCDVDNLASANVARRAGFELEATLRHDDRKPSGELSSTFVFSKIRPDSHHGSLQGSRQGQ